MDAVLLERAVWDAVHTTFEGDDKTASKLYKYLNAGYKAAESAAKNAKGDDVQERKRVEIFLRKWMTTSMPRAWQSTESYQETLSMDVVTTLFRNLVAPFGDEH